MATSGSNVDTYHVHVTVDASACPGDPNATPACNGTAHASVSVASNGTTDPTSGNNGAGTWELGIVVPIEAGQMPGIATAARAMLQRAGIRPE